MRTVINYYDRDVTASTERAYLLESTVIDSINNGASLKRAIEKLPNALRCRYTIDLVPVEVERNNLLSGLPFLEEEDTPAYLSPACESYFSM